MIRYIKDTYIYNMSYLPAPPYIQQYNADGITAVYIIVVNPTVVYISVLGYFIYIFLEDEST